MIAPLHGRSNASPGRAQSVNQPIVENDRAQTNRVSREDARSAHACEISFSDGLTHVPGDELGVGGVRIMTDDTGAPRNP